MNYIDQQINIEKDTYLYDGMSTMWNIPTKSIIYVWFKIYTIEHIFSLNKIISSKLILKYKSEMVHDHLLRMSISKWSWLWECNRY